MFDPSLLWFLFLLIPVSLIVAAAYSGLSSRRERARRLPDLLESDTPVGAERKS
jgi:hypothetical protein